MTSKENENLSSVNPNQQTQPSYQSTNPFTKFLQSPPQDCSAYASPPPGYGHQPYPPQQGSQQQGSTHPQQQVQQNFYPQSGPYYPPPQQGYPPQQASPYPQQGYPQQAYVQYPPTQFSDPNSQVGEAASYYNSGPSPVVQPGPGQGTSSDRGFFDSAMQMAGVQQPPPGPDRGWFSSSKNPLNPAPKMFSRPPPAHYSYINFRPMSVLAISDKLQDGFALMPPVIAPGDQHPFLSHDITEDDWHKFLKDLQKTAHLSSSDRLFQGMGNSFMKDKISSTKIQQRMAENKLEPIGDYLLAWNHYFFQPRRMTVVLAKGNHRFSGEIDDYPPDVNKKDKKKKSYSSSRSVHPPLVTAAEPYHRGSLLGPLLNPLHKALHESTVAVARAPGDLLHGTRPGERSRAGRRSRSRSSDSSSDSSESDSEDEHDLKAIHRLGVTDAVSVHALMQAKRAEREALRGARRAGQKARRDARRQGKRDREKYVQAVYFGNHDAGKQKSNKHDKGEYVGGPTSRFRLVICYWDRHREVY